MLQMVATHKKKKEVCSIIKENKKYANELILQMRRDENRNELVTTAAKKIKNLEKIQGEKNLEAK